jgi:RNA polymerase sigma-70 factor (ECF subfamily)
MEIIFLSVIFLSVHITSMDRPVLSGLEGSGSISSSLLSWVRARDPNAWERLSSLYGPLVYSWARRQGLQDADAADVVQDVFATVAARIDDFRRDAPGATFRGWLWVIARNKLGDHFRRAARPQAAGGTEAQERFQQVCAPSADSVELPSSLVQAALQILRTEFEDRTWQAFWRSAVDGHATADIAHDLGMTPRAVRQAKHRVLRRLRAELGE